MAEFSINPNKIKFNALEFVEISTDLNKYASQLEAIASSGALSSGSYGSIKAVLMQLHTELILEKKSVDSMRKVLVSCADSYIKTEQLIGGSHAQIMSIAESKSFEWEDIVLSVGDTMDAPLYEILDYMIVNGINDDMRKAISQILSGTYLTSKKIDNVVYFKLVQDGMTNKQIGKWLSDNLGGSWDDYLSRNLKDYRFGVYDKANGKFLKGKKIFNGITDTDVGKYIDNLNIDKFKLFKNSFVDEIFDDFNYKNFGELSKVGKVSKLVGTAGTVLTIGEDVFDNFYNADSGNWSFSANQVADCAWDIGVDLAVGAGGMAAGAAVGSLIAPPVGTVVGAAAGVAIDVALNFEFGDFDGDGEKDSLVDGAKMVGHKIVDVVEDVGSDAIDWLGDVFGF